MLFANDYCQACCLQNFLTYYKIWSAIKLLFAMFQASFLKSFVKFNIVVCKVLCFLLQNLVRFNFLFHKVYRFLIKKLLRLNIPEVLDFGQKWLVKTQHCCSQSFGFYDRKCGHIEHCLSQGLSLSNNLSRFDITGCKV